MLTLLRILFLSSLVSCGVKVNTEEAKIINSHSIESLKVPELKLKLETINNNKNYQLTSSLTLKRKWTLEHFQKAKFFSTYNNINSKMYNLVELKDSQEQMANLHFSLPLSPSVCFIKFEIYNNKEFFERSIYQDDIRKGKFTLQDIPFHSSLEYQVIDFKYCEYSYSLKEFIANKQSNHYQVNIDSYDGFKSYMVPVDIKLINFLMKIDKNVTFNEHNRLNYFLGKINFKRLSPINKHPDTHGFWFTTGLVKDNFSYSPRAGEKVTLSYISMKEIRKSLSKRVELIPDQNGIIDVKNKGLYHLRNIQVVGSITEYYSHKEKIRTKSKRSLIGGNFKGCYVYKHSINSRINKINSKEDNKEIFDQLVSHPYPERFIIKAKAKPLTEGFTNIDCKHNVIKHNKKVFILHTQKKNYLDRYQLKLLLTKELIVL